MTTTDTQFDFGAAVGADQEAYHPPERDVAPKGNYRMKIVTQENTTSSGNYPLLKLTLESEAYVQWDNIVISPNEFSVAKLLGLVDSAGLSRPDPAKGEIDPATGKLSDAYTAKLLGREVGVIVRHQGEMRPRVKGYIEAEKVAVDGPTPGATAAPQSSSGQKAPEDIPF